MGRMPTPNEYMNTYIDYMIKNNSNCRNLKPNFAHNNSNIWTMPMFVEQMTQNIETVGKPELLFDKDSFGIMFISLMTRLHSDPTTSLE